MSPGGLSRLEDRLGHRFRTPALLQHALTHASTTTDRLQSNERLEFLGDRVLGLIIADMLFETFPHEPEGDLGYRFTALARRESLARVAQEIDLGASIVMSDGERETGGAAKDGLLANACEAVIAALYQDGGLAAAQYFVERYWTPLLAEDHRPRKDPKTALQEWAQAKGHALPRYQTVHQSGPDHQPIFRVEVRIGEGAPATGEGASKRAAEQAAAEQLLSVMVT
ncbi:MAG: ribonuclease III [Rhodospirillales bacterium]|nr:ribonuclease III [Rhodospirillales bacterium]